MKGAKEKMNRKQRAEIAKETLSILQSGWFFNEDGIKVDIKEDLDKCIMNTVLFKPDDFDWLEKSVSGHISKNKSMVEVTSESTLHAAARLVREDDCKHVLVLNFASAKNPGGGFLNGSLAQEESLARSSGLFASISKQTQYYEYNRNCGTALYSDYLIFSPFVPVFRDDSGKLLTKHDLISFITAPAVNAGAVRRNELHHIERVRPVMLQRVRNVLLAAAENRCDAIIAGAWGCGVFQNDPEEIADIWFIQTMTNNLFKGKFKKIVYAIMDRSEAQSVLNAFSDRFKK